MKLLIAADHAGYGLKEALKAWLAQARAHVAVQDFGTYNADSMDYPDVVHPLARALALEAGPEGGTLGVLICGSGNGVCMAANKHAHIRAALCWTAELAGLARAHNDANVLCLPARWLGAQEAPALLAAFLDTPFEGGRHGRRVEKIAAC